MENNKKIITAKEIIEKQKEKAQKIPQELKAGIEKIKGIYSKELTDYLEALLSFEINIVNDNTCDKNRIEVLKRLRLFRRLVDYNVFEYAKKTIKQVDENIDIYERYFEYFPNFVAQYKITNDDIKTLFRTDYINEKEGSKISFTIYQLEQNEEKRRQRLDRLYKQYHFESKKINPYERNDKNTNFLSDPYSIWEQCHEERKQYYRMSIKELETRKEMNKSEQIEADITKKTFDVFKKEYGSFNEQPGTIEATDTDIKEYSLVKKTPFVNIYTIKKYY